MIDLFDGDQTQAESLENEVDKLVFNRKLTELQKQMSYLRPLERRQFLLEYC